jgi:hypothetical protein
LKFATRTQISARRCYYLTTTRKLATAIEIEGAPSHHRTGVVTQCFRVLICVQTQLFGLRSSNCSALGRECPTVLFFFFFFLKPFPRVGSLFLCYDYPLKVPSWSIYLSVADPEPKVLNQRKSRRPAQDTPFGPRSLWSLHTKGKVPAALIIHKEKTHTIHPPTTGPPVAGHTTIP